MRIGLEIRKYRKRNNMSMETFAKKCNLSKAYIGLLESGVQPKTGKPINPSVDTVKKVAAAMGMDFDTLIRRIDDDIKLNEEIEPTSENEYINDLDEDTIIHAAELIKKLRLLAPFQRMEVMDYIDYLSKKEHSHDQQEITSQTVEVKNQIQVDTEHLLLNPSKALSHYRELTKRKEESSQ